MVFYYHSPETKSLLIQFIHFPPAKLKHAEAHWTISMAGWENELVGKETLQTTSKN